MAVLSTADRDRVWRGLMRYWSKQLEPVAFTKTELRAAIDSIDNWQENNAANASTNTGFNASLPTAFKNSATTAQKTLAFCAVACVRAGVAFARSAFGELD